MTKTFLPLIALIALLVSLSSADLLPSESILKERKIVNINEDWSYLEENYVTVPAMTEGQNWQSIDLPHTWNQWDAVDNAPGYRRDASWYRKEMLLTAYDDAQYILYFEGANITTTVYVNGTQAGSHVGGYVGFEIDITNHINKGQQNTIDVRVDNAYNPDIIPSQKADFFIYGGITRDVWLKILPQTNLKHIRINTPQVSKETADTEVIIDLHQGASLTKEHTIKCQVIEPTSGKVVAEKISVATATNQQQPIKLPTISNPKLWSTASPNLYQVKTQLLKRGKVVDEKIETVGYRWFRFDEYGAFYLNGDRLLLRGTHRHEEHAGYGAAMPNELHIKDMEQIKGMGANFLRLGHYPQDPIVYETCDKLGIILWDELTAIRKYYDGADLVDVFSPSIWSGWYAGVYTNYGNTLKKNQKKYPRFLHMEYGGSSHVGRHTENPITGTGSLNDDDWAEVANQVNVQNIAKGGDWTENYIVDLFDWYLSITETSEDLSGNAQWAFKDFGTPLRPENAIPYLNQKGLVDRAGNPKDAYYVYKSYWSDELFTYIESHTWTERRGPKGKARNVAVYSNCESVELIHNGKSLGKKTRVLGEFPACGLHWDVVFTEGENDLSAIGYQAGEKMADDAMVVSYDYDQAEKADHIDLSYKVLENGNFLVEAFMKDKNGKRVLDYEKHLYFSRDGNGKLLKDYGTPTRSQVIQMANGYAAIELQPASNGKAVIEARNQDFKGSYLTIDFETENTRK